MRSDPLIIEKLPTGSRRVGAERVSSLGVVQGWVFGYGANAAYRC